MRVGYHSHCLRLRSKDYRLPNAGRPVYLVGTRTDVCSAANFSTMVHYMKKDCPQAHQQVSLLDCALSMVSGSTSGLRMSILFLSG